MIPRILMNIRSKGQRSRSQGLKVQKARSSGWRELSILSSAQPLVIIIIIIITIDITVTCWQHHYYLLTDSVDQTVT